MTQHLKENKMTHKLIKTDNYLLVVDDSGIEVGDYYWNKEYPSQVYKRHHYNTSSDYKKIIAHLPLNGSPILEGVDLLPPYSRHQEDGVEKFAESFCKGEELILSSEHIVLKVSYAEGYNKAREKYKYTEEDIEEAMLQMAEYIIKGVESIADVTSAEKAKSIIQSLHQYPTEFECEMETVPHPPPSRGFSVVPKTITTAQGIQWVGKYK